jgi:exodeoxyribonuclease VII large subunit
VFKESSTYSLTQSGPVFSDHLGSNFSSNPDESVSSTVLTVEGLNKNIKQILEGTYPLIWVQGEISNFKAHSSGHFYFSLKDERAQIRAVMFKGSNSRLQYKPHDGLKVICRAKVSVFEQRGEYQLILDQMEPVGLGALQKAFEELKKKLRGEGLFSPDRKRPLPKFPKHIAVITSPTGAAIRDMMNVLSRRNRLVPVTLIPTLVQGPQAAPRIVQALAVAQRIPEVDVIILARGGGSIEDLWCFNEEILARAIVASKVPVISAIGHEIDYTIADFVADVRAPTPSAGAELVLRSSDELIEALERDYKFLQIWIKNIIDSRVQWVDHLTAKLMHPEHALRLKAERIKSALDRLLRATQNGLQRKELRVLAYRKSLPSPKDSLQKWQQRLLTSQKLISSEIKILLEMKRERFHSCMKTLDLLSPLKTVDRGYALILQNEELKTSSSQVDPSLPLVVRMRDGDLICYVDDQPPSKR